MIKAILCYSPIANESKIFHILTRYEVCVAKTNVDKREITIYIKSLHALHLLVHKLNEEISDLDSIVILKTKKLGKLHIKIAKLFGIPIGGIMCE